MSEAEDAAAREAEEKLMKLHYARPRVCRRYQQGSLWKSVVRVVAGVMALPALAGYVLTLVVVPQETWLSIVVLAAVVGLAVMVTWERGLVLRDDLFEGAKDRRAAAWRASASRFDSSGVTILDPHSRGRGE